LVKAIVPTPAANPNLKKSLLSISSLLCLGSKVMSNQALDSSTATTSAGTPRSLTVPTFDPLKPGHVLRPGAPDEFNIDIPPPGKGIPFDLVFPA
jgi:hypothetical protein